MIFYFITSHQYLHMPYQINCFVGITVYVNNKHIAKPT